MPFKAPKAIVETACTAGCSKTELTIPKQLVMGILAGAYIAIGGLLAIVVGRGSPALAAANPGLGKFLFAAVFPVGLMLVVIAGSELFTGNCGVITPSCLTGRARERTRPCARSASQDARCWGRATAARPCRCAQR